MRHLTRAVTAVLLALALMVAPACGDGGDDTNPGQDDPGLDY